MQRLKQNNLVAKLRLNVDDLLLAFRRPQPYRGTLQFVRIHVELGGYAERAYYEIAASYSRFSHSSVRLSEARLGEILAALRAAFAEQPAADPEDDPNGDYRTLDFRDGGRVFRLWTEYVAGAPHPESPASDAAWALLEEQFPTGADA